MATRSDFTEAEWTAIQKGVTGAGMLVSVSDRDFTDGFGEASALAKALAAQRDQSSSQLVREIASVRGTGFGMTASPQEVESETLESIDVALAALAATAPEETEAYRQLVVDVTDAVAEAKGGVALAESGALEKIRGALGAA